MYIQVQAELMTVDVRSVFYESQNCKIAKIQNKMTQTYGTEGVSNES